MEGAPPPRDALFMARALELAARGAGQVAPNPMVGAVVVQGDTIVGEGWHRAFGEPHAEVEALRVAGSAAAGATVYVTLEPCAHHGKTPPCTEALLAAGVARVVCAVRDPNPVAAGGLERLRTAGIRVDLGVGETEARRLNAAFLHAAGGHDLPYVTLKLAVSLDGAIADASRNRRQLTGPASQAVVHQMRAESDAVAVGIGTVLADDPALTVRLVPPPRVAPRRVVFDRRARLPLGSTLVRTAGECPVLVVTAGGDVVAEARLQDAGVMVVQATDLPDALRQLRRLEVRSLLVEGGAHLAAALLAEELVHEVVIFQAPIRLGPGALPAFGPLPVTDRGIPPHLRLFDSAILGDDVMTRYLVAGD